MATKTDQKARADELNRQLKLIYKYKPSLQNLEENIKVLQSLGMDEDKIKEVICTGSTNVFNTIINPLTGEEMAIFVEDVSIRKDKDAGYGVFVGKVPYKEFFSSSLLTQERLETLSKVIPEVKDLYTENLHLKELLAGMGHK